MPIIEIRATLSGKTLCRPAASVAAGLFLLATGCGGPIESPAESVTSSLAMPSTHGSIEASERASSQLPPDHSLVLQPTMVDPEFTTKLLELATDGQTVVWSSGADTSAAAAPDLFAMVPGDHEPRSVFKSTDREANLIPIGVAGDQYAFVESNTTRNGPGTWTLWFVASADAEPVAVDLGDGVAGAPSAPPFFAMSSGRLVWATVHMVDGAATSQLLMIEGPDFERQTLESQPVERVQYWFPALHGDRLVFGTTEIADSGGEDRHVYLMDLSHPAETPLRLDSRGQASMPAIYEDTVVWKEGSPELHVLNAGRLVKYSLSEGAPEPLELGDQNTYPSVGERYVTAWSAAADEPPLYDLSANALVEVDFGLGPTEAIVRPDLAGSLLTWVRGSTDAGTELSVWFAELPGL